MSIRIVRLGTPRVVGEGIRIGTVRRPPRGVPKEKFSTLNYYDVWFPLLAPAPQTVKMALNATAPSQWRAFVRKYRSEMAQPDASRALELLALFSHHSNFSVGCYCEREDRCHRSILRSLFLEKGAVVTHDS
jgi:uncharacterized protein YeaO (DUF488 family)